MSGSTEWTKGETQAPRGQTFQYVQKIQYIKNSQEFSERPFEYKISTLCNE